MSKRDVCVPLQRCQTQISDFSCEAVGAPVGVSAWLPFNLHHHYITVFRGHMLQFKKKKKKERQERAKGREALDVSYALSFCLAVSQWTNPLRLAFDAFGFYTTSQGNIQDISSGVRASGSIFYIATQACFHAKLATLPLSIVQP